MRDAVPVLILCLLVIVGIGTCVATSQQDEPPAADSGQSQDYPVEIPGIDWAALGAWARDNVAVKGSEGEWVGLDELLESLDTFIQAASQSGTKESIDPEHLRVLNEGMSRWTSARGERPDLLWSAVLKASDDPEVWGRLMGALGPGLMAGAHGWGLEARPKLVEEMRQVQAELESARGEARLKLETKCERLQDAITMIDRIPAPSETGRKMWEIIKRLGQKKPDGESKADEPAGG